MAVPGNLIASAALRRARRDAKRRAVLRFLRQHLWSSQDILQQVMGLASRQAAHKALTAMESDQLLRRHTFEALGGRVTLWGITPNGQAHAFDPGIEQPIAAYFEPSRVSEQTIRHQLDLQWLRLRAEAAGWRDWIDGDRITGIGKAGKRPDALATDPRGHLVAVECERTLKSIKRYEQILAFYLRAIHLEKFARVVWVSPTPEISLRVRTILLGIQAVRVAGQRVRVEPERHHRALAFADYSQWPR